MDLSIQFRRRLLLWAVQAWDLAVFAGVIAGLWLLHTRHADPRLLAAATLWRLSLWLIGSAALLHFVLAAADVYRSRRLDRGAGENTALARALGLGISLAGALAVLLGVPEVSLALMLWAWVVATCVVVTGRLAMRGALSTVRRSGRNLRHALIVGSGARARQVVEDLLAQPDLGYCVIGCIDHREAADAGVPGVARLGAIGDIDRVLANNVVDEVVVVPPAESFCETTVRVMQACKRQGVAVSVPMNFFEAEPLPPHFDIVEGIPILRYASHRVTGWPALLKRALDFSVSLLALVLLAPLFAICALLIRLTSPGPIFFIQDRVGLHKHIFRLIKFRTMVPDAEARLERILHLNEAQGPVFKLRNDPRLTRFGRILRRTSLDELPQLLNVLWGDMSLVGPRPLTLRDVAGFSQDSQRRRFSVKPGITCFWQVSGRSGIGFDKWMELDMRYIENWSLGLDLWILLRTLPAVLRGTGAH